jgi:muconolactone delta-isomerase
LGEKRLKKIVKITSIFDNFRIFGVDSTHNELRDQLTSIPPNNERITKLHDKSDCDM